MTEGIIDLAAFLRGGVTGQSDTTEAYEAISYPVSIPEVSGVLALSWSMQQSCAVSESPFTYKQTVHQRLAGRLACSVTLPAMRPAHAAEWRAFIFSLKGQYGTVLFGDLFNSAPRGVAWGSPVINGANQKGYRIETIGWDTNVAGILLAGDWVQIGNTLHAVMKNTNSDGSGGASIELFPAVVTSPSSGQSLITNNARGLFKFTSSSLGIETRTIKGYSSPIGFSLVSVPE